MLQRIAEAEQWEPDNVTVLSEQGERSRALGTSDPGYVIAFWWA